MKNLKTACKKAVFNYEEYKMKEIILLGTTHFPDKLDIFSADVQGQLAGFAEKLASFAPTKIAVEFPAVQ